MIRQYRIDRVNGMEVLVCEVFRKHIWTQEEYDAWLSWKDAQPDSKDEELSQGVFRIVVNEQLSRDNVDTYFGLRYPILVYDIFPHITIRGIIVDNRVAAINADYSQSVIYPELLNEFNEFFTVLDSRHWRDMVSHQIERYGSLFTSPDD